METLERYITELGFSPVIVFYIIVVFFTGLIIYLFIKRHLNAVERKGTSFIDKLKFFEAVRTKTPFSRSVRKQKNSALERFSQRFTIIRRTVLLGYILIWVLIMIFPLLGRIPATLISLVAAVVAAVIGVAARPFLENLISGIVITFSKQFRTGDTVLINDREYGTVEDITITHSVIKLWDWKRLIIPNSQMLNKEMVSYTAKDSFLWAHVEFWVNYEVNINKVKGLAISAALESEYLANSEYPKFWVMGLEKEGVRCWVTVWTKSPTDAWYAKIDIRSRLIEIFKEHNIKTHCYNIDERSSNTGEEVKDDVPK
ncbi:MAG: mechanosensitive ion channel family protein [Bacteroidales bacterium]